MTDGRNNPNDMSDDDWAMSEPDSNIKDKELEITLQPEDVNENVSNLYDPLKTDELEGWDISEENAAPSEPEPSVDAQPQEFDQSPPGFQAPQNTYEIIEPEKPPVFHDSWEVKPASSPDGWKMPEPSFRSSEGKPIQKVTGDFSFRAAAATGQAQQEIDENLSSIYAPPDTVEVVDEDSEDADLSVQEDENVAFDTEDFAEEDFAEMPEAEPDFAELPQATSTFAEQPAEMPVKKRRGKALVFVVVGILVISVILIALSAVGYFFYFDQLNEIIGR